MTTVAIHQPNYVPWLGYFHKMARADIFVFLDDVQFSKQSYINRVKILGDNGPRWLTQPVNVALGDAINEVTIAREGWDRSHLDTLKGFYRRAAAFVDVWPEVRKIYEAVSKDNLAAINRALIAALSQRLGVRPEFRRSSELGLRGITGDDRLVAIVRALAPGGRYISGEGGAGYQNERKFADAGIRLSYSDFKHPFYDQGGDTFHPGLSVLDAVFHLGWDGASELIRA